MPIESCIKTTMPYTRYRGHGNSSSAVTRPAPPPSPFSNQTNGEAKERTKERKKGRKFFRRDEVFPVTVDDTSPRDIPWPILSRGNGIYRMAVNDFTGIEIVVAFRRTSMEHRFRKDRVHLDLRPLKKDYFALPISPPPFLFFFFSFYHLSTFCDDKDDTITLLRRRGWEMDRIVVNSWSKSCN